MWKLDRFVSAAGPAEGATLTTMPMVFTGARLELNVATKANGRITVDFLDAAGKILATSSPFTGDGLRKPPIWPEGFSLTGKPASLLFLLTYAEL